MSKKTTYSLQREKWYYIIKGMVYFGLLFIEIAILFLLSRNISKSLANFMSINFLSFLLLPGVIIHELSHLLIAVILFVPVGNMEFTPKKTENGLKLGSLEITKTDPIRKSIIGFAPVFIGLMLIIGIVYFFTSNISFFKDKDVYIFAISLLTVIYLLFAISNTMFSSRRDMEGTIEILIALLIIFIAAYIIGFRPSFDFVEKILAEEVVGIVQKSALFLLAPIVIDIVLLGAIKSLYKR